jgi:murein DD-endopeptidase MepM/ murein hydrolase activator NlpD
MVTTGQVIGTVGSTGLSSGPHLHWDVRIMNVPVDGLQWLNEQFP